MKKSKVFFIFPSFVIALIGTVFVVNHYIYTRNSFQANLDQQQQTLYNIYNSTLESTYNKMSLQAKFFADDTQVQDLFLYGKKMLQIEGDNAGGDETAKIRARLYQLVLKPWKESTKSLAANIFQFHFGPGSLSFLRVHKPNKFGDKMDNLRFIIVDVNKEQIAKTGFETGRIASALRSIVPVYAWDTQLGRKVYVGAIEIGTSYDSVLQTISQQFDVDLSILLNNQHIKKTVWDEFITVNYNKKTVNGCNCILESSSHTEQKLLLEHVIKTYPLNQLSDTHTQHKLETQLTKYNDKFYSFQFYPLRDYLGNKDSSRKDVGSLFIAKDITDKMLAYQHEQFRNVIYALIAYVLIELILIFTFLKVTKHLISQLKEQSLQLHEQRRVIDLDKVKYKNLIATINSNYFFYSRNNSRFSFVSPSIQQVLGYSDSEFLNNTSNYLTNNSQNILFKIKDDQTFLEQKKNTFEIDVINKGGRLQYLLITETVKYNLSKTQEVVVEGLAQDISHNRQETMLLKLRCQILQMIADNVQQTKIMETLVLGIESIIQDISCAIMLVEQDSETLSIGSAPTINKNLIKFLDGQKISSAIGSCGIAANTSKRIIIYDMKTIKEMTTLKNKLSDIPYQSCWSEPILSDKAKVLATFDIYYKSKQKPNESDFAVVAVGVKLISSLL